LAADAGTAFVRLNVNDEAIGLQICHLGLPKTGSNCERRTEYNLCCAMRQALPGPQMNGTPAQRQFVSVASST